MQIKGTIKKIFLIEENKGFTKRIVWVMIDEDSKYPNKIPVEFTKEKVNDLDRYSEGDKVEIDINIRGNEWNGKIYVNLSGWKIRKEGGSALDQPKSSQAALVIPQQLNGDAPDDLPF